MSRLRPLGLAVLSVLALCAFTASATAKTQTLSPVADCKAHDGTLTHKYTVAELKQALNSISPSINEYTTCYDTIQTALNAGLGVKPINPAGSGSGGGGGSGTLILIIVVVVVVLLGGGGAFWAYRRNQSSAGGSAPD
jgi:hypothetical protein